MESGSGSRVTDLRVVGVLLESSVRLGGQSTPPVQPPALVLIVTLLVQAEKLLGAALHVAGDRRRGVTNAEDNRSHARVDQAKVNVEVNFKKKIHKTYFYPEVAVSICVLNPCNN